MHNPDLEHSLDLVMHCTHTFIIGSVLGGFAWMNFRIAIPHGYRVSVGMRCEILDFPEYYTDHQINQFLRGE